MPVAGNKESGVLPLKKRRFPFVPAPSLPREEAPPCLPEKDTVRKKEESSSGEESPPSIHKKDLVKNKEDFSSGKEQLPSINTKDVLKNKEDSSSGKPPSLHGKYDVKSKEESDSREEPSLNPDLARDSTNMAGVERNLLKEVKKETSAAINTPSVRSSDLPGLMVQETSCITGPDSVNNISNKVKPLLTEKLASPIIPAAFPVFSFLNAKKQITSTQAEGNLKLELSSDSGNARPYVIPKEQLVSPIGHQQIGGSSQMPNKADPSLLSLSVSKESPVLESNSRNSFLSTANFHVGTNRSNWDLNTTMDTWDGSIEDAAVDDTIGIDGLNKTRSASDVKPSWSSTSVLGVGVDKGKRVVDPNEKTSNLCISSFWPSQQYKSEDSLGLSLSTSFPGSNFSQEYSISSTKVGSSRITSNSNLQKLSTEITSSGCRTVKPEPVDGSLLLDSLPDNGSPMRSLDHRTVKIENVGRQSVKVVKMSSSNPQKLVDAISVKSEVEQVGDQETRSGANLLMHQSAAMAVQCQDSCSSSSTIVSMPLTPQQPSSSKLPNCSKLSDSGGISNQSENSLHTEVDNSGGIMGRPAMDMIPEPALDIDNEPNECNDKVSSTQAGDMNVEDSEIYGLKKTDELALHLQPIAEGLVSDEEKINISANMLENDVYGPDYESDGNHSVGGEVDMEISQCGKEENEYEDGEVREPPNCSSEVQSFEVMQTENVQEADNDSKILHPIGSLCDCSTDKVHGGEKPSTADPVNEKPSPAGPVNEKPSPAGPVNETNIHNVREDDVAKTNGNSNQLMEKSLLDTSAAVGANDHRLENQPLDKSAEKDVLEANRKDVLDDGATNMNTLPVTAESEITTGIAQGNNMVGNGDSSLSKGIETSLDAQNAAKESVTGGNRSRIINLPRASNLTSPSRIRSIPGRLLSSRSGRERYSDFDNRDGIHHRGNRDEFYAEVPSKFGRDRIWDQSFRNSRPNFGRGRGRISGRLDTFQGEWDPDHNFASETFDGQTDYRFPRHRRASGVTDAELDNDFVVASDRAALGAGRGGRKPLTQELYSFRHPSSRRISPGARDPPASRNNEIFRRHPRNICESGPDLAGLRHEKKFIRELPDDATDSIYTRPRAGYEELDGQFVRGSRKFSTVQRGFPRVRSKSPINTRSRSPRPWTSPRRRLSDGFNGLPDQTQHRSPAMYRIDRMRSPDLGGYTEEMGSRRHVSPTYVARPNDIRDIDSPRAHGHIRSINSGRSPSDRTFARNTRRLDIVDPRERADSDDYFGGPIHSGRFHEFHGDGSDERKKYGERRSPVRSFRAYGGKNDGYGFNSDDGPRPVRFRPDQDTGIFERNNIREREFEGMIKGRSLMAPGRIRSIEDEEGNYRQTGQIWHDDSFNDDARLKRRRF